MKKINGHTMIERDYVGEVPWRMETKLIKSACNRFLASRGLPTNEHGYNAPFGRGRRKKQTTNGH